MATVKIKKEVKKEIKPKSVKPKSAKKKKTNNGKYGLAFEKRIIKKCKEYKENKVAYIDKIPTDIAVIRKFGKVVDCIFRDKASLDFSGVIKGGKSIYIEAKSSQSKTSFSFSLIKDHQFTIAYDLLEYTDLVFFLIEMREIDKVYLVNAKDLKTFRETSDRQSLPLDWLNKNALSVDYKELNFIEVINEVYYGDK